MKLLSHLIFLLGIAASWSERVYSGTEHAAIAAATYSVGRWLSFELAG